MFKETAFASSLTILSGAFYIILYLLAIVSRDAFRFLFNAQFFGADVASLLPRELTVGGFVGTLVAILVFVWVLATRGRCCITRCPEACRASSQITPFYALRTW